MKNKKPIAKVSGRDGNVFNLIGIVQKSLRKAGKEKEAKEVYERINSEAENYSHAIRIMSDYVELT